jgi:hypothetical protein
MKVDHGAFLSCLRVLTCHPNWMRLHEVHRIMKAKSMAAVSHPDELICTCLHDGRTAMVS